MPANASVPVGNCFERMVVDVNDDYDDVEEDGEDEHDDEDAKLQDERDEGALLRVHGDPARVDNAADGDDIECVTTAVCHSVTI